MTVFDQELRKEVHKFRVENDLKIYEVADLAGISRNDFYHFTAGRRSLKGENVKSLMDALNLTLELNRK